MLKIRASSTFHIRAAFLIAVIYSVCAACAHSIELGSDRLQFRGFGSIAMTHTGNDGLFFPFYLSNDTVTEDGTSFRESLLGLQLDGTLTDELEASIQAVLRDREDHSIDEHIERAFLKYSPDQWYLRGGRLGLDVYMLSEFVDVGFAYPWSHPSMEFYGPFGMDSYDGIELGYIFQLSNGQLEARIYGGQASQQVDQQGATTELDYRPLYGTTLIWTQDAWTWRLGLARNEIDGDIDSLGQLRDYLNAASPIWPEASEIAETLEIEGTPIGFYSLGAEYSAYPWVISSEISYTDIETEVFTTFYSGYLSVGYSTGPFTLFSVGGRIIPEDGRKILEDAPGGFGLEILQQGAQTVFDTSLDQSSLSLGVRWDIKPNTALKAQWDRTWVEEYGGGLWNSDEINTEPVTVDTFSLKLDFVF